MSKITDRLVSLQEKITKAEKERDEASGAHATLMKQLKADFDVDTIPEARIKLNTLLSTRDSAEKKLNTLLSELEKSLS